MKKQALETHTLDEPNRALRVYLDALLCEATFTVETEDKLLEQQKIDVKVEKATVEVGPEAELSTVNEKDVSADTPEKQRDTEDTDSYAPDWAEGEFQCLSFQVAGVMLAAPLEMLDGILELNEPITELPGYSPWVMGLLPNRGKNVQVIDIAEIIMPEDRRATAVPASERMKYLVLIDDGKFGLAADSISEVLSLNAADVRWSRKNNRRPWLAGTVVDKMCALLEMKQLCVQLQSGLKGAV